ncbi:MAG: ABC transporter substrate-binding protein [Candidatus Methylomirabilales bacterium]
MGRLPLGGAAALLLLSTATGAGAERITVGLTSLSPSALPIFAAEQKGYFKEEGLEVSLPVFKSGTENSQAILAGEVQIAFGSITEVLQLRKAQQDVRFFWGISNIMPFKLYARPEIKSVKDLKGKKLAVSKFGAQSDYLTQYTLRRFGVEPIKEAAILQVGSTPARYAALKSGAVDATIMWFPQTLVAEREGFRMLVDLAEIIPDWGYLGYYALASVLGGQREAVVKYLRAHQRGVRDVKENPELGIGILMQKLKYPRDVAEAGYKEYVKSFPDDGRLAIEGFEFLLENEKKVGGLEGHWTVDDMVDRSYVALFGQKK